MRKRIFIAAGLVLFSLTTVWYFVLAPRLTARIPAGWQWESNYIGYQTYADPQTGKISDENAAGTYSQSISIVPNSAQPGSVELHSQYVVRDIASGQVTYAYKYLAPVNPQTGEHLKEEYRGDHFLFPRNVEQKTYNLRFSYLKGVPLIFQREEAVDGLPTYLFAHRGRGEYSESYAGTEKFPGIKVKPGQEIKCAGDQFVFKAWVEPLTGEIVKIEESCHAGDYVYEIATGKQLEAVDRWAGETAGDDVRTKVGIAGRERTRILCHTRYIPASLFVAGLLCFGFAMLPGRSLKNEDE